MEKLEFSVLMSIYKREDPENFREAVESILRQTLLPSEIILVKDGQLTKELDRVLEAFKRKVPNMLKVISLENNMGLGYALKAGLEWCRYEIIARMDTDDISHPERFERQISFLLENEEYDVIGTALEEFNAHPGDLKTFRILPETGTALHRYSKFRSPVNHPTIIFKKSAVMDSGGYNGDILLFEDYSLFARMLVKGYKIYNLQDVLFYQRVGSRIENIKRRSGMHYVRSELKFINYAHRIGHVSFLEKILYIFMKIPLRLLPAKVVLKFYTSFLRQNGA